MTKNSSANPRKNLTSPEELIVEIQDLSRGGAGVARDQTGRVIFVPLTAPGDKVRVRVLEAEKRYAQAELMEVIEASSVRVTPPCAVFGRCGGCQWQHLPYELQWKTKVSGVRHALERVQLAPPQGPGAWTEFPAEKIWEYRNRVQLRGFQDQLGFFARRSNDPVPVNRCEIARPEINDAIPLAREEGRRFEKQYKVELEALPSGEVRKVWNSAHGAAGFRQVHDDQNAKLLSWIREALTPGRVLLDLYGGSGNIGRALADQMDRIHCVDVGAPRERPEGTPANLEFHRAPTAVWLLRQLRNQGRDLRQPLSAVVDPPREGLGPDLPEIISSLQGLGVNEVVAVGCDPDSWARDLSRFCRRGWKLERAAVLDFFPQTPHVESVALIRL